MDRAGYAALLARARRLSRGDEEARDLVQDTLLAAAEQGRTDARIDAAWLAGVMRRQAALRVRGEVRRRRREREAAEGLRPSAPADPAALASRAQAIQTRGGRPPTASWRGSRADARSSWLQALPPASRRLAVLALHGLDADEIRWILGLDAAAFRQRLARLRRALAGLDPAGREAAGEAACRSEAAAMRAGHLPMGRLRRLLRAALRGPALGTHDPDGHLFVLRGGHVPACGGNSRGGPAPSPGSGAAGAGPTR